MRSSARHSHAATSDVTWAHRLAWVVTTPLGFPVVPLVYRIMARRAAPTCGSAERPCAASASVVVRRRTAAGAPPGSRGGADPAAGAGGSEAASLVTDSSSGGGGGGGRGRWGERG